MNIKQLVVGIDILDNYTLVSTCQDPSEGVITYSPDKENEDFKIPVAAYKLPGSEKWVFGEEAVKASERFGEKYKTDLLATAIRDAENEGMEKAEDQILLLGKFISYLLHLPDETSFSRVNALVITKRQVEPIAQTVVIKAVKSVGIGIPSVRVISYNESFFFYALSQPIGLWRSGVQLYDYSDRLFESLNMSIDHGTVPALVKAEKYEYKDMIPFFGADRRKLDERFFNIASEDLKRPVSGTYLTGEAFNERWEQKTLRFICTRSRAFKGQNLYTKGACYAAADDVKLIRISQRYLFLDEDSVMTNVGVRALSGGREIQLAVSDAGEKWYRAGKSLEVLLGHDREVIVVLTDIKDRNERNVVIRLDWLPERPDRASRVRLTFKFTSPEKLGITIEDLGFGEIFRSTGEKRKEEIQL